MAQITQEIIEKVKEQNSSAVLFKGNLSFYDINAAKHEVEFIYRKPCVADMDNFSRQSSKLGLGAQLNLLSSLIVYPEPMEIIEAVKDFPPVVANFIDENVVPFFGTAIASRSSRI